MRSQYKNSLKDSEWSGLLKIPDSEVIKQLRKELADKEIEIGKLNTYIEELEDKRKYFRLLVQKYCDKRTSLYAKALCKQDDAYINLKANNRKYKEKLDLIRNRNIGKRVLFLSRCKMNALLDLVSYGIMYSIEHDLTNLEEKHDLYKEAKQSLDMNRFI